MTSSLKKILYIALIAAAVAVIAILLVRAGYETSFRSPTAPPDLVSVRVPDSDLQTAPASSPSNPASAPSPVQPSVARLSIPSIKLDAAIESVGVDSRGNMATPVRLADVGWYENGTPIGSVGSAVIDGHVDDSLSLPAVFYNLKNVQPGDDIYVTTTSGARLHFSVTAVNDYSVIGAPIQQIFNDTSGDRLINLITCEGTWDSGNYAYDHRIVVTAKLVAGS